MEPLEVTTHASLAPGREADGSGVAKGFESSKSQLVIARSGSEDASFNSSSQRLERTGKPQKCREGPVWARLVRAGSKMLGVGRSRYHGTTDSHESVAVEKDTIGVRVPGNVASLTSSNSRRRGASLSALVLNIGKSCVAAAGNRRHEPCWRAKAPERCAIRASRASSLDNTGTAGAMRMPSHSVDKENQLVSPRSDPSGTGVDCLPERRMFNSILQWKKPVIPLPLDAEPLASRAAAAEDGLACSGEGLDSSFIVVSLASDGTSSPVSWFSEAKKHGCIVESKIGQQQFVDASSSETARSQELGHRPCCNSKTPTSDAPAAPQSSLTQGTPRTSQPTNLSDRNWDLARFHAAECFSRGEGPSLRDIEGPTAESQRIFEHAEGQTLLTGVWESCCPPVKRHPPDIPVLSQLTDSEMDLSVCESLANTGAILDEDQCDKSTPGRSPKEAELLVEEEAQSLSSLQVTLTPNYSQSACNTMQFCNLPGDHPDIKSERLFKTAASVEASKVVLDVTKKPAHAHEMMAVEVKGSLEGTGREVVASVQRSTRPSCMGAERVDIVRNRLERTSSVSERPEAPSSLREVLGLVSGRVVVETDDEIFFSPLGRCAEQPDSPCFSPLSERPVEAAETQSKEPHSLRHQLTTLWDELEALHRKDAEICAPYEGVHVSSTPEFGTWEACLSPSDTQGPQAPRDSALFSKSAAHGTLMSIIGATYPKRGSTGRVKPSTTQIQAGKPDPLKRRSTEGKFGFFDSSVSHRSPSFQSQQLYRVSAWCLSIR